MSLSLGRMLNVPLSLTLFWRILYFVVWLPGRMERMDGEKDYSFTLYWQSRVAEFTLWCACHVCYAFLAEYCFTECDFFSKTGRERSFRWLGAWGLRVPSCRCMSSAFLPFFGLQMEDILIPNIEPQAWQNLFGWRIRQKTMTLSSPEHGIIHGMLRLQGTVKRTGLHLSGFELVTCD